MKLVTIITEGLLKEQVIDVLQSHGTSGYTITRAEGEGSRGVHASHWEGPNLRIETIVTPAMGEAILESIAEKFFDHYSVIAWLSNVEVLRGEKFASE